MGQQVYKIRRKGDGLFSPGGNPPHHSQFTKRGKAWSGIGPLKLHLAQMSRYWPPSVYDDCEIVVFEQVEAETMTLQEVLDDLKANQDKRDAARKKALRLQREEREREQLRKLKARYPDEA
jgi:hypothetical protein